MQRDTAHSFTAVALCILNLDAVWFYHIIPLVIRRIRSEPLPLTDLVCLHACLQAGGRELRPLRCLRS